MKRIGEFVCVFKRESERDQYRRNMHFGVWMAVIQSSQIYTIYAMLLNCTRLKWLEKRINTQCKEKKKKRFFYNFFSTIVCLSSFCFYKRLIIFERTFKIGRGRKNDVEGRENRKQAEQKEFREKWKYNILSRVRTHTLCHLFLGSIWK